MNAERIARAVVTMVALGLIGAGCWMAWKPLGLIVPGFLVWFDLFIETLRGRG